MSMRRKAPTQAFPQQVPPPAQPHDFYQPAPQHYYQGPPAAAHYDPTALPRRPRPGAGLQRSVRPRPRPATVVSGGGSSITSTVGEVVASGLNATLNPDMWANRIDYALGIQGGTRAADYAKWTARAAAAGGAAIVAARTTEFLDDHSATTWKAGYGAPKSKTEFV